MNNCLRIGLVGYSGQEFNRDIAKRNIAQAFDLIQMLTPQHFNIEVVSGLTNLGVPALAYAESVKREWKTVGIACEKAKDYELFPCDEVIIVGTEWGAESPTFLDYCDLFIRVGGGKQSHAEIAAAIAMGKKVIEFDLEAIKAK